jgi:cation diffusion facilitator family transporter
MSADGSRGAVIAACAANAGIGVAKLVGFFLTGATSLLAEAVHSAADTGNQALLLLGASRSEREATERHQFGYARERYFWSFIVAVVLFVMGAVFSLMEGFEKMSHPTPMEQPGIAVIILGIAVVLEGWSFRTAIKAASELKGSLSWGTYLTQTKSAELPVVLLEDLGALVGLILALLGIVASHLTGNARFDAAGTMAIGVLLGAIAWFLSRHLHSMLIGESATMDHQDQIRVAINDRPEVRRLVHMRTMHLGPEHVLLAAKVEFEPQLDFVGIATAIDVIEAAVRSAVPSAKTIYIEPAVYDPSRKPSLPPVA